MITESGKPTDVLVIGAGMAGLAAASALQQAGRRVRVIDKGRGVGGRLAGRRIGDATFDHGAQFITARDPRFIALMEGLQQAGVAEEWCRGFREISNGHPRWRGNPAMTAIAKHLARDIEILLEKTLVSLRLSGDEWLAETPAGETFSAGAVVLTPPVPQSLVLLKSGGVEIDPRIHSALSQIEYERCLAVLAVLDGPSRVPPPGGYSPAGGPVAWIADNRMKGISARPAVTLHATHAFSLEHWDHDRRESGQLLLEAADEWLGAGIEEFQVHGWRYSKPLRTHENPCMLVHPFPPLVLAGDAFAGPKVEGAHLSGLAAAGKILTI